MIPRKQVDDKRAQVRHVYIMKSWALLLLMISGAVAETIPTVATPNALPTGAWPLWRGSSDMRGVSSVELKFPLDLKWKFTAAKPIKATAVSDGTLAFIGDGAGTFHALELATGKVAWQFKLPDAKAKDPIEGSAALLGPHVIFGAGDGAVYCLERATGKQVWRFVTEGEIKGAVNLYQPEGKPAIVLVGSYDNQLYALNSADGSKLWTVPTSNYINGAAALAGKLALFGGCDGFLYMVDVETGKEVGKVEVKDPIANTVATNGKQAFLSHYGNAVLAVDLSSQKTQWSFTETSFPYYSSPAVTEKFVLAGDRGKYLRCLDIASGDEKWAYRATGKVDSSPVVTGSAVCFGSDDGRIYALSLTEGKELWQYEIGPAVQTSPCVAGNRLVMGADDGVIYAFGSKD
jgi:outer membrane protein assembly factor BamB